MEHTPTPTQAAHPWRATFRTAVEVGIPAFLGLSITLTAGDLKEG